MSAEQRDNLKIRHLPDLQEIARREGSLHVCRQIATASKHWEVSQFSDPAVSVSVSASPEWNIYVTQGEKRCSAIQLFEEASAFWTAFIYQNEIAK
jgi:hypothetical protein